MTEERLKLSWIDPLRGCMAGKTIFILGNGWTIRYWNTAKMKEHGMLFGCNKAFKVHDLDFLLWQDPNMWPECMRFARTKFAPYRPNAVDFVKKWGSEGLFFFTWGKLGAGSDIKIDFSNSGALALQIAAFLGFETIILAGCDCVLTPDPAAKGKLRSNIFSDKYGNQVARADKELLRRKGQVTVHNLVTFAEGFRRVYLKLRSRHNIFKLGDFGIVNIPSIDWPEFYSDHHPERASDDRRTQRESAIASLDR